MLGRALKILNRILPATTAALIALVLSAAPVVQVGAAIYGARVNAQNWGQMKAGPGVSIATDGTISVTLDTLIGSTPGDIAWRGTSAWTGIAVNAPLTASSGGIGLSTSGVSAGTYGSATLIPVVTVDTYGRVTGLTTAAFNNGIPVCSRYSMVFYPNAGSTSTLGCMGNTPGGGLVTNASGIGLVTTGVTAGTYGTLTAIPSFTVNSFGQITGVSTNFGGMPLYQANGTLSVAPTNHIVMGQGAMSGGSGFTVNFSGSAAFTSTSTYGCTATDVSRAGAAEINQISNTQIVVTASGGSGDLINYTCIGW